jgi:hypothetical protein
VIKVLKLFGIEKPDLLLGVKQTEAQKYATEIIIADLKNTTIILENTMSVL